MSKGERLDLDAIEAEAHRQGATLTLTVVAEVRRLRKLVISMDQGRGTLIASEIEAREEARLWRALLAAERCLRLARARTDEEHEAARRVKNEVEHRLRAHGLDPDDPRVDADAQEPACEGRSPAAVLREIAGDGWVDEAADAAFDRMLVEDVAGRAKRAMPGRAPHQQPADAGTIEPSPTRAELLTAVEEARAAMREVAARAPYVEVGHEAVNAYKRAVSALERVGSGGSHAKSPVEERAECASCGHSAHHGRPCYLPIGVDARRVCGAQETAR